MVELVQELLLNHNCVIIPGFGAFIGNYQPAEIRLMEHKIYPPNKSIAFNRTLQANDGLLTNAVAAHFSISYKEAEEKVTAFGKSCNEALHRHKSLIFKEIGKLQLDAENSIQFQPYYTKNHLADSYGLNVLSLQPIQRLKDAEAELKESYQRILHPELVTDAVTPKRKSAQLSYWVTAILAISFMVSSLGWNIHKSRIDENQSSMLPVFQDTQLSKPEAVSTPVMVAQEAVAVPGVVTTATPSVVEPAKEAVVLPVAPLTKSYIVIGAFFDESRALKVKQEAENKGFVAVITKDAVNPLFRVSVESANESIAETLEKVKSAMNQRAWVYCISCNLSN